MSSSKLPLILSKLHPLLQKSAAHAPISRSQREIAGASRSYRRMSGTPTSESAHRAGEPPLADPSANAGGSHGGDPGTRGRAWGFWAGFATVGGMAGWKYAKHQEERAHVLLALNSAIPMLMSGDISNARISKLREGTTGVIYAVQTTDASWAVKIMSKDAGEPELEALKALKGKPGVIELHAYGINEDSGRLFLAMDRADGDLYRMFTEGFGEREARRIFPQILDGVRAIHAQGYVHGDLSPDNVLLFQRQGSSTRFVIGDLGNTRKEGDPDLARMKFTPNFGDPEGPRSKEEDVYALGKTLEYLVQQEAPRNRSPELRDLLRRMTASSPADRPTIEEVAAHPWVRDSIPTP